MTVHQFKGLEFPIVFVPEVNDAFNLGEQEGLRFADVTESLAVETDPESGGSRSCPINEFPNWVGWISKIVDLSESLDGERGTVLLGDPEGEHIEIPYRLYDEHRAARGQENPAASGEGRPATTRTGSELSVIANLSPCLLRGMSICPQRLLGLQTAIFLLRVARSSSRRVILPGDQLCWTEDDRESCTDRLDGCYIRGLDCPPRIIKNTIIFCWIVSPPGRIPSSTKHPPSSSCI